jgi:hypothetical protein
VREIVPIDLPRTAIFDPRDRAVRSASRRSCAPARAGRAMTRRLAPDSGLDIAAAEAAYHRARQRECGAAACCPRRHRRALLIWAALVYRLKVPPFIAPSPLLVVTTLYAKFDVLMLNLLPTAIEAISASCSAIYRDPDRHRVRAQEDHGGGVLPVVVVVVNTIPVVAKAPILVLLLGNGMEPKIAIAALICFFPTLVNMVRGLESVNPQAMELMRVLSGLEARGVLQAAPLQLAAVSVLGAEDRGLDSRHRRDRRRMDRLDLRHRRADHPGDVQFRLGHALCDRDRRLGVLGRVLPGDLVRRADGRALAGARRTLKEPEWIASRKSRLRPRGRAHDVLVVGGGPAGFAAAIAAKREGCSVTLIERYPYLGGLASGGMVLVLDDMHNGEEITVTGLCMEMIERMAKVGAAVYPPARGARAELRESTASGRAGAATTSARR